MGMLADQAEYVIGVDTHRDSHTVAVCTPTGAVIAETTVAADACGYQRLLRFAASRPGRRVWAIEGTGSFGAGLTSFLLEQGEWVVEVDRPARRLAATAPSPTSSTPPGPPAKRSRASTSPSRADAVTGRHCASCSPAAKALSSPAPRRSPAQRTDRQRARAAPTATPRAHHRTSSSPAAPACAPARAHSTSTGPRSSPCARPPAARSRSAPRQPSSSPSSHQLVQDARARAARRAGRRPDHRRPAPQRLVTPRPLPLRSRLRLARRHGTDPRLLRPDRPPPAQPRRRPPTQPRPAHDRALTPRATTPKPNATPPAAQPKAKHPARSDAASNATSPAASTDILETNPTCPNQTTRPCP